MQKKYSYLIIIFLMVASFAAFGRIAGNDFINFDDGKYITKNHHIQSGFNLQSIQWAFTCVVSGNWHPLTILSHALDWSFFGAHPAGHHIVSLLLHIGAVIFVFLFFNKTTKRVGPSAFVAALFALHPLRVESVAWAAERKDVLSMFWGMACLYTYAFYAEAHKCSRYLLCLLFFALSLMSKPMMVSLPFVLLLFDYWPLGRLQRNIAPSITIKTAESDINKNNKKRKADSTAEKAKPMSFINFSKILRPLLLEKTPFLVLTLISIFLTLWAQNKDHLVISMEQIPFPTRAANAIISYGSYLGKIFWPVDLAIHYPYEQTFPLVPFLISCCILTGVTVLVIHVVRKSPFLLVGWLLYLGTLIPVIGLVQVASQSMADRYTYLPSIGIFMMLSFGIASFFSRQDIIKRILFPAAIIVLCMLGILTWKQCGYWKSSISLFSHALHVTEKNYMAHGGLAIALLNEGKTEQAIEHFNHAIRIQPIPQFYGKRGIAYDKLGMYQNAIEDYNEAIRLKPGYAEAYYNRGIAYFKQGQHKTACLEAQKMCSVLGDCQLLKIAREKGLCP